MHAPGQSSSSNPNMPGQLAHTHNHFGIGVTAPYRSTQAIQEISLPPPPSASAHGQSGSANLSVSKKRGRRRSRGAASVGMNAGDGASEEWEVHKRIRVGAEYAGNTDREGRGNSPSVRVFLLFIPPFLSCPSRWILKFLHVVCFLF